jgi:hypothetical protein
MAQSARGRQLPGIAQAFCVLGVLCGFAPGYETDWGADRLLVAGPLGQHGIAADRTRGPDTIFAAAVVRGPVGDTLRLLRSVDRGENWSLIWSAFRLDQRLSNLCLRYAGGAENWVFLFWIADDGANAGDLHGARIAPDGSAVDYLRPAPAGPDTLRWVAATRSFARDYTVHLFYQDELGLAGPARAPRIMYTVSADFGMTWSAPVPVLDDCETPSCDFGGADRIYLAASCLSRRDIIVCRSLDGGAAWDSVWITTDTFYDLFPAVAATHLADSVQHVWVSYDTRRSTAGYWSLRGAYTTNGGANWSLDREIASAPPRHCFWSRLDCPPDSSCVVRAAFLVMTGASCHVSFREGTNPNPFYWTAAAAIGDSLADNTGPPLVTSYGAYGDSANLGVLLYAQSGPRNLWFDAARFAALAEPDGNPLRPGTALRARIDGDRLVVSCEMDRGGPVRLALYEASGRRFAAWSFTAPASGRYERTLSTGPLPAGSWFLRMVRHEGSAVVRLTAFGPR